MTVKKANADDFVTFVSASLSGVEKTAKSSFMDNVRHHLPRIRLPDSVVGTSLGALGGLGIAGLRDVLSDDEETDNARYATYGLAGGLGGFGLGNLVGDRLRRYVANNAPPFGYSALNSPESPEGQLAAQLGVENPSPAGWLKPRSWDQVYRTAILDRPDADMVKYMTHRGNVGDTGPEGIGLAPFDAMGRIELLRRHLGLPVKPEDAIFQSTGKRTFSPTTTPAGEMISGGVPGTREHLEFAEDNLKRWLTPRTKVNTTGNLSLGRTLGDPVNVPKDPEAFAQAIREGKSVIEALEEHGGKYKYGPAGFNSAIENLKGLIFEPPTVPSLRERKIPNKSVNLPSEVIQEHLGTKANPKYTALLEDGMEEPFKSIFARHGTEIDREQSTGRIFDHWDFQLSPSESSLLGTYLTLPKEQLEKPFTIKLRSELSRKGIIDWVGGGSDEPDPTFNDHKRDLLKRWILNSVLGSGGPVVDQKFHLDGNGRIVPLPYQATQSQSALDRLKASPLDFGD